ncbi:zinc ABC transporter substrate-binding protein [Bacillus sp. ISL-47]|uniref:metal ABC transporter solute-binding protein, Zn/Mn family n=1 Tax=Bacillus sp. ISL-47 TaxID=2819130 RepID=UPI001BEA97D7|nr:zinc ABC transporter substrate-binding protein [Bacillus sp. ISL-47]MBT2690323.1 zinc ABC transporter substrate-binding protein [Bacillus sp. ISL-47]MBT2706527.1 zinc ABC transporter substrate-binding protein [Pseudomonas sp. ISL-84]
MKKAIIFLTLGLILVLSACTDEPPAKEGGENKKETVYTTVYPLQYFTERIGGDFIQVETVYPPGSDEHTFEPSQKDMMNLADSDLFIFVGLGLEGFVEKAKETLKNENVTMAAAGENIEFVHSEDNHDAAHEEEGHSEEHSGEEEESHSDDHSGEAEEGNDDHNHGDIDPHVWLDPLYAKEMAKSVKAALAEQMPEHEEQFEKNYQELAQELDDLHSDFEQTIKNAKHKEFIVSHAAYGYWEERYGLDQISVSGLNSSSEPTQKELQKIIAEAKEHDLKYVFFEQNVSSRLTEILQKEIGAKPLMLHNLSVLTEEDIQDNQTYFTLMRDNLASLEKALNE